MVRHRRIRGTILNGCNSHSPHGGGHGAGSHLRTSSMTSPRWLGSTRCPGSGNGEVISYNLNPGIVSNSFWYSSVKSARYSPAFFVVVYHDFSPSTVRERYPLAQRKLM